jgi:hypothetical protein
MAYRLLYLIAMPSTRNPRDPEFGPNIPDIQEVMTQAEENFRKGLKTLSEWSEQARDIFQKNPGAILTSVALAGFVTGVMLRRKSPALQRANVPLKADPLVLFVAGAIAGVTVGPQVLESALSQSSPPSEAPLRRAPTSPA